MQMRRLINEYVKTRNHPHSRVRREGIWRGAGSLSQVARRDWWLIMCASAMHPSHSSDLARVALHKLPRGSLIWMYRPPPCLPAHLYARTCVIKEIHFSSFAAQSKCKSNKYSSVARRERAVINGEQRRFKIYGNNAHHVKPHWHSPIIQIWVFHSWFWEIIFLITFLNQTKLSISSLVKLSLKKRT